MTSEKQILVIGLGSTLRGDDALGRIACERLRPLVDPRQVKVIDQAAPTPELAAEVSAAALVIFLDASVDGPPDQVVMHRLSAAGCTNAMTHSLAPGSIVALADRLYDRLPQAYLITFRGRSFDAGDNQLSSEAETACDSIIQWTLELIGQGARTSRPNNPQMQVD